MKKLLILLVILICGCTREYTPSEWNPGPYYVPVDCCLSANQVQGAIKTALLKRKWHIIDIQDNNIYTQLACNGVNATVVFTNTDRDYVVSLHNVMETSYSGNYCIESYINDINQIVYKYLRKMSIKQAKREMKGKI